MDQQLNSFPDYQPSFSTADTFRLLVESVKDYGIFLIDPKGYIKTWNTGARNIKGYEKNEIIGKHFSVFYPKDDVKAGKPDNELKQASLLGRFEDEGWRVRKDGTRFWANVVITPIRKDNGELLGFSKVTRDLSERKRLEDEVLEARNALAKRVELTTTELEQTQERLTLAVQAAQLGIFDWDIPNNQIFWSDTLLKMWNYHRDEFSGTLEGVKERIHPEDITRFNQAVKDTLEDRKDYELEYRIVWPDKSVHWVYAKGKAFRDQMGIVQRFTGIGADITQRKVAEERDKILDQASLIFSSSLDYKDTLEATSKLIVPSFANWIVIVLCEGNAIQRFLVYHPDPAKAELARQFQGLNASLTARGGVSKALLEKRTILRPSPTENEPSEELEFLSTEDPDHFEIIRSLGIQSYISSVMQVRGKIIGGITYIADHSRAHYQKNDIPFAEQFANRAAMAVDAGKIYKSAQDAIRIREEVVSIVSHDLKNPLNSVLLNTSLLLKMKSTEGQVPLMKRNIESIKRSAERMKSMIEDILDVTKLDAGTFTIEPRQGDMRSTILEAVELHKPLAEEKSIHLSAEMENNCCTTRFDSQRIMQVLSNLIGNALKFTPKGGSINISVKLIENFLIVSVRDSGPGISLDQASHIFDRYWQARAASKTGAGLGLFIAKGIVEAHQGKIWVEGQEGHGANFIFTLPRT